MVSFSRKIQNGWIITWGELRGQVLWSQVLHTAGYRKPGADYSIAFWDTNQITLAKGGELLFLPESWILAWD